MADEIARVLIQAFAESDQGVPRAGLEPEIDVARGDQRAEIPARPLPGRSRS